MLQNQPNTITIIKLLTIISIIIAFFPFAFHLHLISIVLSLAFLLVIFQVIQNKDIKRILNPYTILMSLWFLVGFISLFWVVNKRAWLTSVGVLYIATLFAYILTYLSHSNNFYSRLKSGLWRHYFNPPAFSVGAVVYPAGEGLVFFTNYISVSKSDVVLSKYK